MTPDADLRSALEALLVRLVNFSRFPKYSLERRIDIFLVPFIEALVRAELDPNAELVAPGFPVLAPEARSATWTHEQSHRRPIR